MNRGFAVLLPESFDMGALIGTQSSLLAALGWDLGLKYDAYMRPNHGNTWLEDLRQDRWAATGHNIYKHSLTLTDPSFVLSEPLMHSQSPLRKCLPHGAEFFDLMDTVLKIRNEAQHFKQPLSASLLQGRAKAIGQFAKFANLPLALDCKAVLERINSISQGGPIKSPTSSQVAALAEKLAVEQAAAQKLALEVARAKHQLRTAAEGVEKQKGLTEQQAAQIEELRDELILAQTAKALAEEQQSATSSAIEFERANQRAESDLVADLAPGDPWPIAPGAQILRLMTHVGGLYDVATEALLSDSVGQVAVDAAARWRDYLPHGGVIHLSEAGQACALVGAGYVYLGSLDDRVLG